MNKPTLDDIKHLAEQNGVSFTSGEGWFDLDKHNGVEGTYADNEMGIEAAYGDLVRQQLTQQK